MRSPILKLKKLGNLVKIIEASIVLLESKTVKNKKDFSKQIPTKARAVSINPKALKARTTLRVAGKILVTEAELIKIRNDYLFVY